MSINPDDLPDILHAAEHSDGSTFMPDSDGAYDPFHLDMTTVTAEGDELTEICRTFVLEHDMPDDTDPDSIRREVWRSLSPYNRAALFIRGIRP